MPHLHSALMQKSSKWGVQTLEKKRKIQIDCSELLYSYGELWVRVRKCKFNLRKFAYKVYRPIFLEMLS